jgi:hypothetical protein
MIDETRLGSWHREALSHLARFHGTGDARGELAARLLATIHELWDLSRYLEAEPCRT